MNAINISKDIQPLGRWQGPSEAVHFQEEIIRSLLQNLDAAPLLIRNGQRLGAAAGGTIHPWKESSSGYPILARARAFSPREFGHPGFLADHGLRYAYMAGSMANGISSVEMVIGLGKFGYLASFGAGGLPPDRVEAAIHSIQAELPQGPYAFNLIHSPNEPRLEKKTVELYLQHQVRTVEASAFLRLTPPLVQYRAAGLERDPAGRIRIRNKVIAKLSRREVARHFLRPAPEKILRKLVQGGKITPEQAALAQEVPLADDITVEADSGGHTDNRPLTSLLPSLIALRDQSQREYPHLKPVRVGAAGGIGTPTSVLGAFSMGADYVVTGSVNQGCREADTSDRVKKLLAEAEATDVLMAPSADMFEMGARVQVLKRGTLFPMRAQKLFQIYHDHGGIPDLDPAAREELEAKIFQCDLQEVWEDCISFFSARDPEVLERARGNPRKKMALIFRWYLGLATHWAIQGEKERAMDYQIWCGPSMGAFNNWTSGSPLADPANRRVVTVADQLMSGAAYLYRLFDLKLQGITLPPAWCSLLPGGTDDQLTSP